MKTFNYFFLFFLFFSYGSFAQNGISYQALILNPNHNAIPGVNDVGAPLANKNICLRFAIIDSNNQIEYLETQKVVTDGFGMVNLVIGTGDQVGGYANSFSDIIWNNLAKSLRVELDVNAICTYFVEISNQPFTSVPFALYAANTPIQNATTTSLGIVMLSGDLGGTALSPLITNIQGHPLNASAPVAGQLLYYNGSSWVPTSLSSLLRYETENIIPTNDQTDFTTANIPLGKLSFFINGVRVPRGAITISGSNVVYNPSLNDNYLIQSSDIITIDYIF